MLAHDRIRLMHMLEAANEALLFVEQASRASLENDRKLVLALVKDVEIIGEAASKVGIETKALASEIPWDEIIVMRHRLVHDYFDVDLDIVWSTVQRDLPDLVKQLENALKKEP
jgi:uncharacterized protein with HEPN domain